MLSVQFVVSSPVHDDFAAYGSKTQAEALAHRLNRGLFDAIVYLPLAMLEFVVSVEQESMLNRKYAEAAFDVVTVDEV